MPAGKKTPWWTVQGPRRISSDGSGRSKPTRRSGPRSRSPGGPSSGWWPTPPRPPGGTPRPPTGAAYPAIKAMLAEANGRRRARLLGFPDVCAVLDAVGDAPPGSFAWTDGRLGKRGHNFHRPRTTLVMAYRDSLGRVYFGTRECPAFRATPGRAWSDLKPWAGTPTEGRFRKLGAWARNA